MWKIEKYKNNCLVSTEIMSSFAAEIFLGGYPRANHGSVRADYDPDVLLVYTFIDENKTLPSVTGVY